MTEFEQIETLKKQVAELTAYKVENDKKEVQAQLIEKYRLTDDADLQLEYALMKTDFSQPYDVAFSQAETILKKVCADTNVELLEPGQCHAQRWIEENSQREARRAEYTENIKKHLK